MKASIAVMVSAAFIILLARDSTQLFQFRILRLLRKVIWDKYLLIVMPQNIQLSL